MESANTISAFLLDEPIYCSIVAWMPVCAVWVGVVLFLGRVFVFVFLLSLSWDEVVSVPLFVVVLSNPRLEFPPQDRLHLLHFGPPTIFNEMRSCPWRKISHNG